MKTNFGDLISKYEKQTGKPIMSFPRSGNLCPTEDKVFRCFEYFNVEDTKIVILGQDPYYSNDQATGLAFECKSGEQPSLKNILKVYNKSKIDFEEWAKKGVLLMNTALTTEEGKAKAHSKEWKGFTKFILESIANINESPKSNKQIPNDTEIKNMKGPLFVCWGNDAINLCDGFGKKICSSHPSPLGFSKSLSSGYPSFKDSDVFNRIEMITEISL